MEVKLIRVTHDALRDLYDWDRIEPRREYFTCRPLKELPERQVYCEQLETRIQNGDLNIYVLISEEKKTLGKVILFDFNPRNQSAEFGYYLPPEHREKGLGTRMVELFLIEIFNNDSSLNKVYATTASNNTYSIKLLQGLGFKLDGSMREHYWINNLKYDQFNYSMLRTDWLMKQP